MGKTICASCSGKGRVGDAPCVLCHATGLVDTPDFRTDDGPGYPPLPPVTGALKVLTVLLLIGALGASYAAYQNAPGSGNSKIMPAVITFCILAFSAIIVVRMLQHVLQIAVLAAVAAAIDLVFNDGNITRAAVGLAQTLISGGISLVRQLMLGRA